MQLDAPFIRLPLRFDVRPVLEQLASVAEVDWQAHPQNYAENWSLPLVSSEGEINDRFVGEMQPTLHLRRLTSITPMLAALETLIGRARLMRLGAGAEVEAHADVHAYWADRVRVHIPLRTHPEVMFYCDGVPLHMRAGEAWLFDNKRVHRVENSSSEERIHLVVDTVGSPAFWELVAAGERVQRSEDIDSLPEHPGLVVAGDESAGFDELEFERFSSWSVMPPGEVQRHLQQVIDSCPEAGPVCEAALERLLLDWRYCWGLHADALAGRPAFEAARNRFRAAWEPRAADDWRTATGAKFVAMMRARTEALLRDQAPAIILGAASTPVRPGAVARAGPPVFDRPVFILAAPRSGSTLLFETLSRHRSLYTIGGEGHGLFEGQIGLPIERLGYASNRLLADDATPAIAERLGLAIGQRLRGARGQPWSPSFAGESVRLLEKTPKNILRLPFLREIFPDARFVVLYREPGPSIASMMEAWESGRFVTYPQLPDWPGMPWSLLLVPDWQDLAGQPLARIVAEQWHRANTTLLDDLAGLPEDQFTLVRYEDFVQRPQQELARLCAFADLNLGVRMRAITARGLELSRYTVSPPDPDKWRRRAGEIEPLLDQLLPVWQQLSALQRRGESR